MSFARTIAGKLDNAIREAATHYRLFGIHGLFLTLKSRLFKKQIQVELKLPGITHPLHLRLRTSDIEVFSEILLDSQYALAYPINPRIIVDAGANIGLASVWYANQYPQARILAIEPEKANYEMLRKNTVPYSNITPVRAALWKADCELRLSESRDGVWDFWGFQVTQSEDQRVSKANGCSVLGITVNTLMENNGIGYIDLLKVDVEGAEKELFENSATWIDHVGGIAIETHDRFKKGCSDSVFAATANFDLRWERGETTFLLRTSPAGGSLPGQGLATKLPGKIEPSRRPSNLPLKVRECIPCWSK